MFIADEVIVANQTPFCSTYRRIDVRRIKRDSIYSCPSPVSLWIKYRDKNADKHFLIRMAGRHVYCVQELTEKLRKSSAASWIPCSCTPTFTLSSLSVVEKAYVHSAESCHGILREQLRGVISEHGCTIIK